jgi:hypothetical protein
MQPDHDSHILRHLLLGFLALVGTFLINDYLIDIPNLAQIPLAGALMFFLFATIASACFYKAPPDCLGIVYRGGTTPIWVEPTKRVWFLPGVHSKQTPVNLLEQRSPFTFDGILSRDLVPVECKLIATYCLDPRNAPSAYLPATLQMLQNGAWQTFIENILREEISIFVSERNFRDSISHVGRVALKWELSYRLSDQGKTFGIKADQHTCVSVQMIGLSEEIRKSLAASYAESIAAKRRPPPLNPGGAQPSTGVPPSKPTP